MYHERVGSRPVPNTPQVTGKTRTSPLGLSVTQELPYNGLLASLSLVTYLREPDTLPHYQMASALSLHVEFENDLILTPRLGLTRNPALRLNVGSPLCNTTGRPSSGRPVPHYPRFPHG